MEYSEAVKTKVRRIFGTQVALARELECSPMTVSQWFRPGRRVPAERCREIVALADGRISLHELRPDVFPDSSKSAA